jgi:hypothetical protein
VIGLRTFENLLKRSVGDRARRKPGDPESLLLPGAFFVAIGAELFAPFVLVDFRFASFFQ